MRARKHSDGSRDKLALFQVPSHKKRDNVWLMPTATAKSLGHPATFPVNIVQDHIMSWSNEGDLVYDPFMGSGTTGLAAKSSIGNGSVLKLAKPMSKLLG